MVLRWPTVCTSDNIVVTRDLLECPENEKRVRLSVHAPRKFARSQTSCIDNYTLEMSKPHLLHMYLLKRMSSTRSEIPTVIAFPLLQ